MRPLSKGAAEVLRLIQSFIRRGQQAFPSQAWLAGKLGRCMRSIKYYVAELREAGYLAVKKRQHSSALYQVLKQPIARLVARLERKPCTSERNPPYCINLEPLAEKNKHNCAALNRPTPGHYQHAELHRRFMEEFPGQRSDLAAQLFISVIQTQEQADLFARNFDLYLQCDQWRRGIRPSAENFLSKGLWKYAPPRDPEVSKPKSSLERWLESA